MSPPPDETDVTGLNRVGVSMAPVLYLSGCPERAQVVRSTEDIKACFGTLITGKLQNIARSPRVHRSAMRPLPNTAPKGRRQRLPHEHISFLSMPVLMRR